MLPESSFHALLQQLQDQHDNEVKALHGKIQELQVASTKKSVEDCPSPKASARGPRVHRPLSLHSLGTVGEIETTTLSIPREFDDSQEPTTPGTPVPASPKPAGDIQEVDSVEGVNEEEGLGNTNMSPTTSGHLPVEQLQVPPMRAGLITPTGSTGTSRFSNPKTPSEEDGPPTLYVRTKRWARSDSFELLVGFLVTLNFLTMAMELQYEGLQSGYDLRMRFYDQPAVEAWPWALDLFQAFRTAFLVIFSAEILFRVTFLRTEFFRTPFNVIDLLALLASLVELINWNLPVDPTLLRLCRLAKLFRTIRVLKVSGMLDSLSMLARCMSSSGLTLVWSLLFLLVIQLIAAMMVNFMVNDYLADESEDEERRKAVYRYYGTFTMTVLTLFEVFFANWAPACRVLVDNISEWYSLLFLIYRCGIGFAVINVVNAVFVQQTLQVAKGDEEVLFLERQKAEETYLQNVERIFESLDTSGDGLLSWAEFEVLLQEPKLCFLLDKLEIAAGDLKTLFDLLDDTGDDEISVHEFIEGITKFKGAAKSLDVGTLLLRSRRVERGLMHLEQHLLPRELQQQHHHHERHDARSRSRTGSKLA